MIRCASGSIHVVTNVARLRCGSPSSTSSWPISRIASTRRHPDLRQLVVWNVLADVLVAEPALEVREAGFVFRFDGQASASQDLGLLGRELLLGEDALRLQVGQLLQLRDLAGRGRPWRVEAVAAGRTPVPAAGSPAPAATSVPAWRRDTRLETEVAVPAITAVRATPRSSPGMVLSFRARTWPRRPRARPAALAPGCGRTLRAGRRLPASAFANGAAQRFSNTISNAAVPGSIAFPASSLSSSDRSPEDAPSKTAKSAFPSPSMSPISRALVEPSSALLMNIRSRIRITPRSTRSRRSGAAPPLCTPSGNSIST